MRVINFSDARNQLKSVLDQVVNDADYTIITRRNAAHLNQSIKQYRMGKTEQHGLIDN